MRELLKPIDEVYQAFAKQYRGSTGGKVTLRECPVCGFLEWASTNREGEGVSVERRSPWDAPCPDCTRVLMRAPEIYSWVVNVLAMAVRESAPAEKSPRAEDRAHVRD